MDSLVRRGYRSSTEYNFREEHTDAILRTTTHHFSDHTRSVIWFPSYEHATIRPSILSPCQRASGNGCGAFDRLALEILHLILMYLDLRSLFLFWHTNVATMQTIHAQKHYQLVVSHGLNLLCALLRTSLAEKVSLLDLYGALCTKHCIFYGNFGGDHITLGLT